MLGIHAFNAADGRGVLSLGVVGDRRVEGIVLGVLVVGGAGMVAWACDGITGMIVGAKDEERGGLPVVGGSGVVKEKGRLKEKGGGKVWKRYVGDSVGMRFVLLLVGLWILNLVTK